MDTSNERPTQGAHAAVGELAMESSDWRSQTQRQSIMNKILDIFNEHLPFSGYERQQELKKMAERVEEEIYTGATNQSEYSRKICFNMLAIETRIQSPMSGPSIPQTNNLNGGDWQDEVYQKIKAMKKLYVLESSDWRAGLKAESRQRVVNKMIYSWHHPSLIHEELQELKKIAVRYEQKTYTAATSQAEYLQKISLKIMKMENRIMHTNIGSNGMQGSSSLSSGLPPGSGLQQNSMANVSGQNSNLQNIQNMSNVQQNSVGNTMGNNNFANQRQIPGRQQLVPQQQQQQQPQSQQQPQAQNSHYHYQQQLQQMAKQKLQPSMQSHIQQPQQPQQQLIPQQLLQQQPQTQNSHYLYQQHLQQMAKQAHSQQLQQMRSHMMHNNIGSTSKGMQGSSSQSSAMSPGSSLPQPAMQQLMLREQVIQQQKLQQSMLQQLILREQMLRATEGASGTVADHTMESGDWRDQLQANSRERIRNKIMDTLKRHLPFSGEEELNKTGERIEEGFYAVATSQSDYLRQISLKMLTMENTSHNPI